MKRKQQSTVTLTHRCLNPTTYLDCCRAFVAIVVVIGVGVVVVIIVGGAGRVELWGGVVPIQARGPHPPYPSRTHPHRRIRVRLHL